MRATLDATTAKAHGIETVGDRLERAIRYVTLVQAGVKALGAGEYDTRSVSQANVAEAIVRHCDDLLGDLYWVSIAGCSEAPAPTDDERAAVGRTRKGSAR